ncbi:AraC family transcriptional regulator ligand-binding domain-containing protein [Vibrio amylolyticus]|uniref:AraC family transcriptional regulator n=1 Tax=Vibrio amylolyticus TaxID=2847292 RepID=UPI003554716A
MTDSDFSNSVSIASILDIIDACEELPTQAQSQYEALGIGVIHQQSPLERISEKKVIGLWHLLNEFRTCPSVGLNIGKKITPEAKGVLASWVSQCDTLGEALRIFQDNIALMNPSERWTTVNDGEFSSVVLTIESEKNYPILAIERGMSAMVTWTRMLSAHPFPIYNAEFNFSKPDYIEAYENVFGSCLSFEAKENRLTFRSLLLDLPIASSSRYVKELMEETAKETLNNLNDTHTMKTLVSNIIIKNMSNGHLIGADIVANQLFISRQTLYRKLEKEKTTYKDIVDDVRKRHVISSFSQPKPPDIVSLSYSLGFKDTSSFYKAFKRWFDITPKEYTSRKR